MDVEKIFIVIYLLVMYVLLYMFFIFEIIYLFRSVFFFFMVYFFNVYCKLFSKFARSINVREERKLGGLFNVELIFYRCIVVLVEIVICDYIVIIVGYSLIIL